jgi:hypothetical protein
MKHYNRILNLSIALLLLVILQGCELITDIFAAGFWVGIVIAVLVIIVVVWLIIKGMKKMT